MLKEKLYIIKIGGNVINSPSLLDKFLDDFAAIQGKKLLVHGGGKILEELAVKLEVAQQMVNGRRITDAATLDLALMVYGGLINKKITASLQKRHCNAIGLSGADMNLVKAQRRPAGEIDFGLVGDVSAGSVNADAIAALLEIGAVPVFCALSHDGQGQILNTNADSMTAALAAGLSGLFETELHYCFEKNGVLLDPAEEDSVIDIIHVSEWPQLLSAQVISAGMIPKLETAFQAVQKGAGRVIIGHASHINENIQSEKKRGTCLVA